MDNKPLIYSTSVDGRLVTAETQKSVFDINEDLVTKTIKSTSKVEFIKESKIKKGIILSGGLGTRLYPLTNGICKQLLPVYDKPMIYYPLTTLMSLDIRNILIICTHRDIDIFKKIFGDGSQFGIQISFEIQDEPKGIAECFIIGEKFIEDDSVCLILGDNLFFGIDHLDILSEINADNGGMIFCYKVKNPERYGVVEFDLNKNPINIIEKPKHFISEYAVTGMYFYDNTVVQKAMNLKPSSRNELEITDINNIYIKEGGLRANILSNDSVWMDAGTYDSLIEAGQYVQIMEKRQGIKLSCPEEIAYKKKWISKKEIENAIKLCGNNSYKDYLINLIS